MQSPNPNLFVITGAPGAGKTTLLNALAARGYTCVPEVARQIIQEQQATGGDAVPWRNTTAYIELMLERSITSSLEHQQARHVTSFDRGLPDTLGYAHIISSPKLRQIELPAIATGMRTQSSSFLPGVGSMQPTASANKPSTRPSPHYGRFSMPTVRAATRPSCCPNPHLTRERTLFSLICANVAI